MLQNANFLFIEVLSVVIYCNQHISFYVCYFQKDQSSTKFKKIISFRDFQVILFIRIYMDKPHKCFGKCVGISVKVTNNPILFTCIVFKIKTNFRLAWYYRVMDFENSQIKWQIVLKNLWRTSVSSQCI